MCNQREYQTILDLRLRLVSRKELFIYDRVIILYSIEKTTYSPHDSAVFTLTVKITNRRQTVCIMMSKPLDNTSHSLSRGNHRLYCMYKYIIIITIGQRIKVYLLTSRLHACQTRIAKSGFREVSRIYE